MAIVQGRDIRAAGARVVDWFAGGLLGLWVYGDSLRTTRVWQEVRFQATALLLQYMVDLWAWTMAWWFALQNRIVAPLLGFAIATLILAYDRSVVVMDTGSDKDPEAGVRMPITGWRVGGGRLGRNVILRVGLLLFLAAITAIPTELAVFSPEITRRHDDAEKRDVDTIRARAERLETERYAARIADARQTGTGDVTQLQSQRDALRTRTVETHSQRRHDLQERVRVAREAVIRESAGAGATRRRGAGRVYDALNNDARTAEGNLNDFEQDAQANLEAFDAETQRLREQQMGNGNGEVTRLARERDAKIAEIRSAPAARLAMQYQGTWQRPNGLLERFRILEDMRHHDWATNVLVWGCRLMMMVVGLLVLGLKLTASQETRRYYSLAAQAAAGHPGAVEAVKTMGYDNLRSFGMEPEARDRTGDFYDACRECADALLEFSSYIHQLASEKESVDSRRHLKFAIIRSKLHARWMQSVVPTINVVSRSAERLRLTGMAAPSWPGDLNDGQDPRDPTFKLWEVSEADLTNSFGWINPQPELDRLEAARKRILELRSQLSRLITQADQAMIRLIGERRRPEEILKIRLGHWQSNFEPCLTELEALERELVDGGMLIPEWPRHFPDPRATLHRRFYGVIQERMRRMDAEDDAALQLNAPLWVCAACANQNPEDARFCGGCGHDRTQRVVIASLDPACPQCNAIDTGVRYCVNCGHDYGEARSQRQAPPPPLPPTWDCGNCTTKGIAATEAECPSCHASKPNGHTPPPPANTWDCGNCTEKAIDDTATECPSCHTARPVAVPPPPVIT